MITETTELTDTERGYLLQLLERNHTDMLHELHHAATNDFKVWLRAKIVINESLTTKLSRGI